MKLLNRLILKSIIISLILFIQVSFIHAQLQGCGNDLDKVSYTFLKGKKFIFDERPGRSDKFGGWTTPIGSNLVLNRIQRAGFNVFSPCIWHGNGALYAAGKDIPREKQFEKQSNRQDNDAFYHLIKEAHSRNIQVYAWFCVSLRDPPLNFLTDFYDKTETPNRAFDIHRPNFRRYIVDVMVDIVKNYDIDGFLLDMIRTQGICTCAFCQQEYKKIYHEDLLIDAKFWRINPAAKQRLGKWQRDAVSEIVSDFSLRAKALKPNLKITAAGHPDVEFDQLHYNGRDLVYWFNKGWLDFIMAMDYDQKLKHEGYTKILPKLKDPAGLVIIVGNYDKSESNNRPMILPRDPLLVNELTRESIEMYKSKAVGIYWYYSLSNEQIEILSSSAFRE